MPGDDFDRVEVDHLIRELASRRAKPKPAPSRAANTPEPSTSAEASAAAAPVKREPVVRPVTQLPRLPATIRQALAARVVADTMPRSDRWQAFAGGLEDARGRLSQIRDLVAMPDPVLMVRLWVGLGVELAVAMPFWPYPKTNAWWVIFYMFAVAMVVVAGIWSARLTWATRLGIAHIVALTIVLWGITLAAEETLPLMGYANIDAASICAAPPGGSRG
jgi:hypothetical protein